MRIQIEDLDIAFDQGTLSRGLAYYREQRVTIKHVEDAAGIAVAEVQGSGHKAYATTLYYENDELFSECSCPVTQDCKHGAALAFALLNRARAQRAASMPVQHSMFDALEDQSASLPAGRQTTSGAALDQWLNQLQTLPAPGSAAQNTLLERGRDHLIFSIASTAGDCVLHPLRAYLKKDGEWSRPKPAKLGYHTYYYYNRPAYLTQDMAILLQMLDGSRRDDRFLIADASGAMALRILVEQRRVFTDDSLQKPLRPGPARTLDLEWQQQGDTLQLLMQVPQAKDWQLLDLHPPHYVDLPNAQFGPLTTPLDAPALRQLRQLPPVPMERAAQVAHALDTRLPPGQVPAPPITQPETLDTPVAQLRLIARELPEGLRIPGAVFNVGYGPLSLEPMLGYGPERTRAEIRQHEGISYRVLRQYDTEAGLADQLMDMGLEPLAYMGGHELVWMLADPGRPDLIDAWSRFERESLPQLEADGWLIEAEPDYGIPVREAKFELSLRDHEQSWFDFSLTLDLGDGQLATEDLIAHWLENDAPEAMTIAYQAEWVRLDTRPLQQMRELIEELYSEGALGKPARLPRFRAAALADDDSLDDRDAPLTRELAKRLRNFSGVPAIAPPQGLNAILREYQQQGLNWLHFIHDYGFGGILADDMGLGKTLQTLALLQQLKHSGHLAQPALVIAPTSLMGNWMHEAQHFTPGLTLTLIHGPERKTRFADIPHSDIVLSSYPLLLRDAEQYASHRFSVLILDEAQAIKNPQTKLARQVREIKAQCRLCLSGTPLENHLGELWALMDFVLPGLLGGRKHFRRFYRTPIEEHGNQERQQLLAQRVAPFMLRRTKSEVVSELPLKTELVQYVELGGRQRTLYESIRVAMQERIRSLVASKGMARSHIEFLDALLKLRQACIDPRLVKLERARKISESAKLEWLADNLPQLLEEGRKVLIFSQFVEVLGLVEALLRGEGISYSKLTGQTRKRQQAIDRFQQGEVDVFLISLKAGGSGLNLTAADVVIHLDPWWNPAVEAQATDRAHRIGQDKPVFVYKLIATDTVEERIQDMQREKKALSDALFDQTGNSRLPSDGKALLALLE